jgi:surface antigen
MNYVKSGVAMAIIFAATVFGGTAAYADDASQIVVARDPSQIQTTSPSTEVSKTVEITVAAGDSLTVIATTHGTTVDEIVRLNNISDPNVIEIGMVLQLPGDEAIVPESTGDSYDQLRAAATAFITPPAPVVTSPSVSKASGRSTVNPMVSYGSSAGNSYVWGTCTWYVKERKPGIPNRLGNGGYGWLTTAAAAGYATGSAPAPGAIGDESGHVVIVESVNGDGTVNISEMNYAGGVGVVHYRTTPAGEFQYIYA